ncbi:MAG: amidohydrolase family protein [Caldilineaceae bacterium]
MSIIDAHIHYGDDDPALLALLTELDAKLLNICFVHDAQDPWREQATTYGALAQAHPQRFAWCTSFALPDFANPHYVDQAIASLARDFQAGAEACKLWKNIGMDVRTPSGEFFMVDDPLFDPIFEYLAASGRPLLTHIAEPLECWQPLKPGSPHYGYYSKNPQWHMYNRPDFPSHEQLMAARDHVLAKHPNLRMIGAHLGSLEWDVDVLAARLDRYPNFAVDISARLVDLVCQDSDKVREFFIKYQDRLLFGTDVVMRQKPSTMNDVDKAAAIQYLRETYETHFAYFDEEQPVTVRSRTTQGLGLPAAVLEKFYWTNARHWYPGI